MRFRHLFAIALSMLLAACSGSSAPPSPSPTAVAPTPTSTAVPSPEAFSQVPAILPPPPLLPGTVTSPEGFTPALTIEVPQGWYGSSGGGAGFGIGKGLNLAEERFDACSISVEVLDMPIDEASSRFATIDGIHAGKPTSDSIDGLAATRFTATTLTGHSVGLDALGTTSDINEWSHEQLFVDLGSKTLFIRTELVDAAAESELSQVLDSLRFPG